MILIIHHRRRSSALGLAHALITDRSSLLRRRAGRLVPGAMFCLPVWNPPGNIFTRQARLVDDSAKEMLAGYNITVGKKFSEGRRPERFIFQPALKLLT